MNHIKIFSFIMLEYDFADHYPNDVN